MLQIKETALISEYKDGNNANMANFVRLWKTRMVTQQMSYAVKAVNSSDADELTINCLPRRDYFFVY